MISPRHRKAFSLVEMLITIAVIGIMAAVAIPQIGNVIGGSKRTMAENVVAGLNKATREFSHANWELRVPAHRSHKDENTVLLTLQYQDPDEDRLGPRGPFMRPDWVPARSQSISKPTEHYRATWNGYSWELREPGESGHGLIIVHDGSDLGQTNTALNSFTLPTP